MNTSTQSTDDLTQRSSSSGSSCSQDRGGKYLTFFLGGEEYGLEILKVQEIIGMMPITAIPRSPKFVRGVINLRGKIIPVVDLRLKLEMEAKEQTDQTCMIVVQSTSGQIAIIVDSVSEVLDIASEDIEDSPTLGDRVRSDYILGIGKSEGKVKLLLDIDKALAMGDTEYESIAAVAEAAELQGSSVNVGNSQTDQDSIDMEAAA